MDRIPVFGTGTVLKPFDLSAGSAILLNVVEAEATVLQKAAGETPKAGFEELSRIGLVRVWCLQ